MSGPTYLLMAADGCQTPFTIPGTTRTYSVANPGTTPVPLEDALILLQHGWTGAVGGQFIGYGTTAGEPPVPSRLVGQIWMHASGNAINVWAGPIAGWLKVFSGAAGT